jgi:hypothetical protein
MSDGIVKIGGKEYVTVARRIHDFRQDHPDWTIATEVLTADNIVKVRTEISDETGRLRATGHAEEDRTLGNINKTSAVENAETSSVGRALAFLGYGGTEIRSAEEMDTAMYQQEVVSHIEYAALVREHFDEIAYIKGHLANDEIQEARAVYKELTPELQMRLWRAPTKGGIFTTEERAKMKGTNNV